MIPTYTKQQEYKRTLEMLPDILKKEHGLYFALAFLYDSGYEGKDLKEMMKLIYPKDYKRNENK